MNHNQRRQPVKKKTRKPRKKSAPKATIVNRQPTKATSPRLLIAAPAPVTGPSRDEIRPQVVEILTRVANPASLPVGDEAKDLTDDHGITDTGKENLAPSFSRISRDKYEGLTVSRADSKK